MRRTEEVQHHFHGIEGLEGNFHEERVPVAHGAVPQAGELESLELAALEALGADEAGFRIHMLEEVELAALVVAQAADEVHGIEVRGMGHGLRRAGVLLVDLDTFEDLERGGAVLAGDDVRAAAGLALVADHAAHADRAVEFRAEHRDALLLAAGERKLDAELLVQEVLDFVAQLHRGLGVQLAEVLEDAVADLQGLAHEDFLVAGGGPEELLVGDIVDVLDGHELLVDLVQVVDEGAMAGGTEQERFVVRAERLVLRIHGNGVGGLVLEGESDVVLHAVAGLEDGLDLGEGRLEEGLVLRGDGDDQVAGAVGIAHVGRGLHEVLGDGGAHFPALVAVELDHALGLGAVAEAFVREDLAQDGLPVGGRIFLLAKEFLGVEGEFVNLGGELRAGGVGWEVLPLLEGGETGENVLEHAGSRAGSRHELALAGDLRAFVIADGGIGLRLGQDADAAVRRGRAHDLHPREAFLEMFDLFLDAADGGAALLDLVGVFLVEHGYQLGCVNVIRCRIPGGTGTGSGASRSPWARSGT